MLYKKNTAKTLSAELFETPTSEYRAAPFWSWNNKLDKDQLLRQIDALKQMGFGGFHMHSRAGLATEYLGDEFMDMVNACCEKAESEQMLAWLYDEDRWPSGGAGGKVTKDKRLRRKRFVLLPHKVESALPKEEALEKGTIYFLAAYDLTIGADGFIDRYSRIGIDDEAKGDKWYAYCEVEWDSAWHNGGSYLDTMDKESVARFIEVTHERYKEVVGDRFNKSVPAIFTDEPNVMQDGDEAKIPTPDYRWVIKCGWSRYFEEEYLKYYGEDILDRIPELFWKKADGSDSIVKYRYFDFLAHQFSENFSGQLGDWCRDNGIALTGHLLLEAELGGQAPTCGETMRNYGRFVIPGIDMLCNWHEFTTAKQTQSAVHQYGREGMLSELYGVTNWDYDFRGHKLQGDWQAALGVTVRVPHLAWVSMKGEAKRDFPAAIGYQSPWYKEYPYIEDHFARLNTALTRGTPIVKLGVIHPIESYWISTGPNSQTANTIATLESNFRNITNWLLEEHLDFNFICESTLPSLSSDTDAKAVGKMQYDAIVVPACITLRKTTVDYLERFAKSGGKVVFMGSCPTHLDGVISDGCSKLYGKSQAIDFDKPSLVYALSDIRNIGITYNDGRQADRFIYNYRQDNDCRWLFIAHSKDPEAYCGVKDSLHCDDLTITIEGTFVPTEYETLTGKISPVAYEHKDGKTVIKYRFYTCSSLLLRLAENADISEKTDKQYDVVCAFDIRKAVNYTLSEPNVLLLDRAEYTCDDGEWECEEEALRVSTKARETFGMRPNSNQPYVLSAKPAEHTVHLRYTFESEIEVTGAMLAIEDADVIDIRLNGAKVDNNIIGYFTDESISKIPLPTINKGSNILEVDVPFGERTNIEWCYILGDFGVKLMGANAVITEKQDKIGFGDIVPQGMPFYGANVTYNIEIDMPEDGAVSVQSEVYRGSLVAVELDGKRVDRIVLPPYKSVIENVQKGKHTISLTLFGNRHNSFGPLHLVNSATQWIGPEAWRTSGWNWCYEYRTKPLGIIKSPIIEILKTKE